MAITNFKFPGVELTQEFVETPVTGVSTLGVVVVGKQYKLIKPDLDDPDMVISGWTTSTTALSETDLPGYVVDDDTVDMDATYTPQVLVRDGVFDVYTAGTTVTVGGSNYSIAVSSSTIAAGKKSATVTFGANLQSGSSAANIFGNRAPQVGDPVVVVGSGTTSVAATIVGITGGTTVEIETTGATISGSSITSFEFDVKESRLLDAGVSATADGVAISNAGAYIGGATISGNNRPDNKLKAGTYDISVGFRMTNNSYVGKVGSVGSVTEIEDIFGAIGTANPMALALVFALYAGVDNIVYFTSVASETAEAYAEALDLLDKYDAIYSVVPMTSSSSIISACLTSVRNISENKESKVRRTLWYGIETPTGATNTDKVNSIVENRPTQSYRAQAVWADDVYFNGELVPNFIVAAAPAGMRAYEPTYRPISNLPYTFFTVKNTNGFTKSQLETLGANGIWIIDNNFEGTPINKKQVTTAVSNNLNKDEESIVSNADSIALTLCHVGENLVGCSNISPALLKSLSDTITALMDTYLINMTGNVYVGPQLLSWSLDSLYQHQTLLDHIYAVITCEPPKPFNRFVMTLRIV